VTAAVAAAPTALATASPTATNVEVAAARAVATPNAASGPRTLLDLALGPASPIAWPNNPQSTGWLAADGYHLFARQPRQFVAIGTPTDPQASDVAITATFHKVGGPPGGGFGIIARDQGRAARDGVNQSGSFYVLEVGDRGEIGIWRRDDDQWVDIVPWTASTAVRPGNSENQVTVRVVGSQLSLSVNGTEVASGADGTLRDGSVGIFAGGDQNEVVLTRLTIQTAN
jgi:hypothetical protein